MLLGRPVVAHPHDDGDVHHWVEVRLIDRNGADNNPHLDFVLQDIDDIRGVLPQASPIADFRAALARAEGSGR